MAGRPEELQIVIRKNGEVWVEGPGLTPRRLAHYRDLMEDILGPAQITAGPGESPPKPNARYEGEEEQSEVEKEKAKRLRLGE